MDDFFVTFNLYTVGVVVITGFFIGLLLVHEFAIILLALLQEDAVDLVLRLLPVFVAIFGCLFIIAFYLLSIGTDLITSDGNNVVRSAGRGFGNIAFVLAVSIGSEVSVRRRRA